VLRKLAIALALAQLAVFTAAPVLEGFVASRGASALEPSIGTTASGPVFAHDPSDCAACSLIHAKAWTPHHATSSTPAAAPAQVAPHRTRTRPAPPVNRSVLSRAPPVAFA
jgi:hypothetical protein